MTLKEINEYSRGCRLTQPRLLQVVDIVSEKFSISRESAFSKIKKTRNIKLTETNKMICPNCGKATTLGLDGQREYRYCDICNRREYVEFD